MLQAVESAGEAVGITVRAERERRGWSQEALAARMRALGMPNWRQTTVAKVEGFKRNSSERVENPRPVTLQEAVALAFALGLPRLDDLFGEPRALPDLLLRNYSDRAQAELEKSMRHAREVLARFGGSDAVKDFEEKVAEGQAELDRQKAELADDKGRWRAVLEAFEAKYADRRDLSGDE